MNVSIILVCSGVFLYIFGSFVIEHNTIVYDGYSYPWPVGEDAEHHQMRLDRQKIWRYVGRALSYIGTVLTALASFHW
jgi:hypothetical protein